MVIIGPANVKPVRLSPIYRGVPHNEGDLGLQVKRFAKSTHVTFRLAAGAVGPDHSAVDQLLYQTRIAMNFNQHVA